MYTEQELKDFVFDTLGDFVNPNSDILIDKYGVIILRNHGIPKEVFFDEWKTKVKGTKFESVALYA